MIKNYFKIILRNLWRNKLYTGINIIGLSLGIAALVWGVQTYRYSFNFDAFHKNKDQVFRVLTKMQGNDMLKGICPLPLGNFAKQDFSGIRQTVRWDNRGLDIKADQNEPFASSAHFTDPAFFELFNFPLVKGTVDLNDKSTVVITETAAKKYFGNIDPLGKTLLFYSAEPFRKPLTVTGVLKDPPFNSSLQFELITNIDNNRKADGTEIKNDDWGWFANAVFLKLSNPADAARLEKGFSKYIPLQQEARKDLKLTGFKMESVADLAMQSNMLESNGLVERPGDAAAYGPLVLALLVLLSACLNFANTSVAQSNRRLKEMGIRKVMGSSRRQIILQQLVECLLIVLIAIAFSILINKWWLPAFNGMFNFVNVTATYLTDYKLLIILAIILLGVTLIAGGYPAFYISRFNASNIFRGSVKFGGRNLFSRILLGLQIAIAFITVITGLAFSRNASFQKNYDYGYEKDNVIGFFVQSANDYHALRNEINKIPGIEMMAGTKQHIGFWQRTASLESAGEKKESQYLEVGENYINTLQLKLVAGRDFHAEGKGDIERSMLINQKLAFQFGWKDEEAIGKQLRIDTSLCTVVGVLKDFTPGNLFEPIQPFAMRMVDPSKYAQLIIRTKPSELTRVYDQARATWAKLFPLKPFRGYYQSETAAESLRTNSSIATIFFWFAIISVLLTATGLFALISLTVLKKTREIAIRKVVGANATHIYQLILKGYVLIFLLAAGLGCYAGYTLSKILMDLVFRIHAGVNISTLGVSFACVLLIAAATVGSRVWVALRTKTTDVLKGD
jgi:putative ABC transport system permease protein